MTITDAAACEMVLNHTVRVAPKGQSTQAACSILQHLLTSPYPATRRDRVLSLPAAPSGGASNPKFLKTYLKSFVLSDYVSTVGM
jgi:hypothetical protein